MMTSNSGSASSRGEDALIDAFVDGRPGARAALIDAFLPEVLQWCARLGGPHVQPEDAAHDVFLVVLMKLDTLRDRRAFRAWLFGVTRRTLNHHRRRSWLKRWAPWPGADLASGVQDPEAESARREADRQIQLALEALPALQREALVLFEVEGRTISEIAELTGAPESTVKSRLRLARARFRRLAVQRSLVPLEPAK